MRKFSMFYIACVNDKLYNYHIKENMEKELNCMRFIISGKNIDVTPGLRKNIEQKLGKLERYFTPTTEIIVTLSVEKERQKIEVTIPVKGTIIRSEQVSDDMYVSIDLVEEVIERQLRKYKNKIIDKHQEGGNLQPDFMDLDEDMDDDEIKIIRTKRFGIKPMFPEDACVQMELLGHAFFVFMNAETDEVNVVYKRKNGTYGLIEPEF
jgi:putative sigma-54 modulation protein